MTPRPAEEQPVVVALTVGELGRYHAFTIALSSVLKPPGSMINMVQSLSVAANLNMIVKDALERPEMVAVWCQADDHVFRPDSLLRLLERNVDVVVPLITRRRPPFASLIFKEETEEGFMPYPWDEIPSEGLFGPVFSAGTGGMLIRREVFERMRDWQGHERWFEFSSGEIINEDTEFCAKLRAMDPPVPIWVDTEVQMGHCSMAVVWPQLDDKKEWGLTFMMGDGPEGAMKGFFVKPGERPEGV